MAANGKALCDRYDRLWQAASTHFTFCDEMAPFIAPSRVGIRTIRQPGTTQTSGVYDSTSLMAAELMAQFISSYTMNPAQQWGGMRMRNPQFRDDDAVNEWLEECRDRQLASFRDSLFYAEGPESQIDWVGFGTGCLIADEVPRGSVRAPATGFRGFRYEAQRTGRFVIAEGPDGLIDTLMRTMTLTADTLQRRWGDGPLPEKVTRAIQEKKLDETFSVLHAVYPRSESERRYAGGAKGMPWASCWVERDSKQVLGESGYRVFPGAVSRYHRTPGEVMGRGRGHIAFPDTWTLSQAKRMSLEDFALKIQPPVLARHDSVMGTLRLVPAGYTSINTHGRSIQDSIQPWQTGSHPEVSQINEEALRKSIRQIFFVEQILALMEVNKSEMTAFEFSKKLELLFRLLGPVYGRQEREFLHQIWDHSFDLHLAHGLFSPPPPALEAMDGDIETVFENPLAKAQRSADVESVTLAVQDLTPFATVFPQIMDGFDPDKLRKHIFAVRGVPAIVARNDDEIAAVRAERLKSQQDEQMLAQAGQVAEAAKNTAPLLKVLQGGQQGAA